MEVKPFPYALALHGKKKNCRNAHKIWSLLKKMRKRGETQIREQKLHNCEHHQIMVTFQSDAMLQCCHKLQPAKWVGDQTKIYFLYGSTVSGLEVH